MFAGKSSIEQITYYIVGIWQTKDSCTDFPPTKNLAVSNLPNIASLSTVIRMSPSKAKIQQL